MVNVNKLRGRMVEKRLRIAEVAELINISRSALYRKLHRPEFLTISEALRLKEVLELTDEEAIDVFFKLKVAHVQCRKVRS